MAADDFDDSDVRYAAAAANEELRRIAAIRASEALDKIEKFARQLKADIAAFHAETRERYERDMARITMLSTQIDNWIGLIDEMKKKEE